MNVNEINIIRALMMCTKPGTHDCFNNLGECPYEEHGCRIQMEKDALKLIREKNNRIWELICQNEEKNENTKLKKHGWISVKDRLPNCNGCYLVWRPRFYPEKGMPSICYFDGSNTWHDAYGVDFTRVLKPEDITHWMDLPEEPTNRR